ncbi:MAG: hypothetical protein CMO80_11290 [Verrucomicrobiales bacterium]|nr:hypothetical protein [Verrucomicrobiales bacterium]|tara:strand:+ start:2451 stop:3002 length:552 start_codon:yes stop_codon:yes gene_type:complete
MGRSRETVADEFLVIAARQGDGSALNDLLVRWQDRLWRFACSLTQDEHDAREVFQETCIAIARGITRLNDVGTFPKWAYTIASRRYADLVRRNERHRQAKEDCQSDRSDQTDLLPSAGELRLHEALDGIALADRRLLCLAYLEEWSHRDLATLLGIPLGTVKSRLFNAKQKLKQKMTKDQDEH